MFSRQVSVLNKYCAIYPTYTFTNLIENYEIFIKEEEEKRSDPKNVDLKDLKELKELKELSKDLWNWSKVGLCNYTKDLEKCDAMISSFDEMEKKICTANDQDISR